MKNENDPLRSWLALLGTANGLKKTFDTRMRAEFGLSISRFDVLAALDRAGPDGLRAGALSQQLMVTEGNTTQVTAPLIRDRLVTRAADRQDGRAAIFKLTAKGEKTFAAIAAAHRQWVDSAFAALKPAELEQFRRMLGKINAAEPLANERAAS